MHECRSTYTAFARICEIEGHPVSERTAPFYPRVQGVFAIANPNNSSVFRTNHPGWIIESFWIRLIFRVFSPPLGYFRNWVNGLVTRVHNPINLIISGIIPSLRTIDSKFLRQKNPCIWNIFGTLPSSQKDPSSLSYRCRKGSMISCPLW